MKSFVCQGIWMISGRKVKLSVLNCSYKTKEAVSKFSLTTEYTKNSRSTRSLNNSLSALCVLRTFSVTSVVYINTSF